MLKIKKFLIFVSVIVLVFVIAGCASDREPPVLTIENTTITHAVNAEVDFLKGVTVEDNATAADKIKVEVSDWGSYDKSKAGTYKIVIKATDAKGNFTTKEITVIVKSDLTAPMVNTSSITTINHLAGETVDLTKGLTGVDNVDGTDVIFKVTEYGNYNKDVAGTYTVQITVSDKAGNESAPFSRTIVVSNSFTRAEMTSFAGETIRFQALYNPQVLNGNTGTGYNTAYNGDYVNVLSKDYVEWLLEYAPERIGSGVGWSIVAVTDAKNEIVHVRHWNSGEAFFDEDGKLVSQKAKTWSTGTVYTWTETIDDKMVGMSNGRYSSGEMGLMLANINEWIPEDGHVFLFLNWTTLQKEDDKVVLKANASDMARSMGANYIMNSDEDGDEVMDYAIGRKLFIVDPQLSHQDVRKSFDSENPFPIITIPSIRYVNDNGIWKSDYTDKVYLENYNSENPYNPLKGITANDGKGNDITSEITYKVYHYTTTELQYKLFPSIPVTDPLWGEFFEETWKLSEKETTLEQALVPANDEYYFVIEYQVTANNHTDTAYRLIQVKAKTPDYLELYGESDTVYTDVMGLQQRLEMNPDLSGFGDMDTTEKGIIFDALKFGELATLPTLSSGVVVILDNYYRVQLARVANGAIFELDGTGTAKTTGLSWTGEDLLAGLKDIVPTGGYVVIYPSGKNNMVLNKALQAFYDFDYTGGEITTVEPKNGNVLVKLVIKEVREVSTLLVNGEAPKIVVNNNTITVNVIENSVDSLIFNSGGGGAGFRLDTGKAYYYTKDEYAVLSQNATVISSFTTLSPNKGVPWFRDGVLIVVDGDGKFVLARVMTTTAAAEVRADGTVIYGNAAVIAQSEAAKAAAGEANLTWDLVIPNAVNTVAHGPLMDIMNIIPDGGAFFVLPGSKTSDVRNLGIKLIWNADYPGSGIIIDSTLAEQPAGNPDPATNGFDFENYNKAYLENLVFKSNFVSTVTDKPAKIARPVLSITDNIASWNEVTGAGSYDIYVNGVLRKTGITETSFDLRLIIQDDLVNNVQVRAIAENPKLSSTSVLSNVAQISFTRLDTPTGLSINGDILTWTAVDSADHYLIYVNDVLFGETATNEFDLAEARGSSTKNIQVQAIPRADDVEHVASLLSDIVLFGDVMGYYLELSLETQELTFTTVDEWLTKRNIVVAAGGFSGMPGVFYIENPIAFKDVANQAALITANGTSILFDATGKVKAVRTIVGQFEWLATNNPEENNGWTVKTDYTAGQVKVSEIAAIVEEGDFMLVTSAATTKQDGAQLNPRDFLAYHFQASWDFPTASEGWRGTIDTFINPSNTTYSVVRRVVTFK